MKILGNTVGTTIPKPNLTQNDPKGGDYVFGKDAVLVGKRTAEGGEIFNDYENNVAEEGGHAEGFRTKAFEERGHAEGDCTEAGWRSHAEGFGTYADNTSHAGGRLAKATGKCSFAYGMVKTTEVKINDTSVMTTKAVALEDVNVSVNQSVLGVVNVGDFITLYAAGVVPTDCRRVTAISADGLTLTIEYPFGDINYTTAIETEEAAAVPSGVLLRVSVGCEASGEGAVAVGVATKARGQGAFAEGRYTNATGPASHASGTNTDASGANSHTEGELTKASGSSGHAEGYETEANGNASHAEGWKTKANTSYSHVEGCGSEVNGLYGHAEGWRTKASGQYQHAQGKYNVEDTANKYAHIVGNGTSASKRSNAHTLDWNGNGWFAGDVYVGDTGQDDGQKLATQKYVHSARGFSLNNVVCIGDSFLAGEGANGFGWGSRLWRMATLLNPDAQFYQQAQGWTGFVRKVDSINFTGLIQKQAADMSDEAREAVETVIIVGGVNDVRSHAAVSEDDVEFTPFDIDITDTVSMAADKFPNARVVVAMSPICTKAEMVASCYQQLRCPSTDPNVCVLTDSYQWLLGKPGYVSEDGLHPNYDGYSQIAAHLFYASRGIHCDSHYEYTQAYSGDFGSVSITYSKSGNDVSFRVVGTVASVEDVDYVQIGSRPYWMCHLHEAVIPVWSTVPNTALYFTGAGTFIRIPAQSGTAVFNGNATISLDMI